MADVLEGSKSAVLDYTDPRDPFDRLPEFLIALPLGNFKCRVPDGPWSDLPGWTRIDVDLQIFGGLQVLAKVEHDRYGRWLVARMRTGAHVLMVQA